MTPQASAMAIASPTTIAIATINETSYSTPWKVSATSPGFSASQASP